MHREHTIPMATAIRGASFVYTREGLYLDLGVAGTEDFDVFACIPDVAETSHHSYAHVEIEKWIVLGDSIAL